MTRIFEIEVTGLAKDVTETDVYNAITQAINKISHSKILKAFIPKHINESFHTKTYK